MSKDRSLAALAAWLFGIILGMLLGVVLRIPASRADEPAPVPVPHVRLNHQGIAIGPILFIVAILAVLVGALAAGSNGFTSSTADDSNRTIAGAVIEQGTNLKTGFDRIFVNGGLPPEVIISQNLSIPGTDINNQMIALYGPNGGGITRMQPPAQAMKTVGEDWQFVPKADVYGVGSLGANDFIVVFEVSRADICKAINSIIFGRNSDQAKTLPAITDAPSVSSFNGQNAAASAAEGNTFIVPAEANIPGRTQACVATGSGASARFWYYQVVYPDAY